MRCMLCCQSNKTNKPYLHKAWARASARTHPRQRPDVVLVAVGDDDGLDLVLPLVQEAGVRQDLLHAQVLEVGEHEPGVNHLYAAHGQHNMVLLPH